MRVNSTRYNVILLQELEAIEEQWRSETKELVSLVAKLQDENRKLIKVQNPNNQSPTTPPDGNDAEMLQKLKDSLEKHREEIREKEKLIQEKCLDADNVSY